MKPPPFLRPLSGNNVVTASDLVRHFGLWQDRANRQPIYVLHRGRPRLMLASMEIMQALCVRQDPLAGDGSTMGPGVDTLLELTRDIILLVDPDLVLLRTSHAAKRYFGERARPGAVLHDVMLTPNADLLMGAVRRTMATGLAETMEIGASFPGRSMAVVIDRIDVGACLRISDVTVADELAAARATQLGDADALAATGLMAMGRINLRGYLEAPITAIAAMAGIDPASLAGTRLISLIDLGVRPAVGHAIELAIDTQAATCVDAALLMGGADAKPVRIGFAPISRGSQIDAISVAVVVQQEPAPKN